MGSLTEDQREEVRDIVQDEIPTVTDESGTEWSLTDIAEEFGITRRQALYVMALMGVGYSIGGALRKVLVGGAGAAVTGGSGDLGSRDNPVGQAWIQNLRVQNIFNEEGHGFLGLPNHHINYASGLSNEELSRFTLDSADVLQLWRLDCQLKGGGTNSNVSLDVYDATNGIVLASVTAGERKEGGSSPLGTSGAGATILVRLSTGSNAVDITATGITSVVSQ